MIQDKPCRVVPFQKDARLRKLAPKTNVFVKNLDPNTTSAALQDAFAPFGVIVSCKVADDESGANHRGFGYVNYETPEAAEDAIGKMNGAMLDGRSIFVGHHISKRDRLSKIEELKANFTNLYVKNIAPNVTEAEFQELFAKEGDLVSFSLPLDDEGHSRGFGFVNYRTHEQAVAAVEALNGFEFYGKKLYASRAQKKYEREEEMRRQYETARLRRIAKYSSTNLYIKYLDSSVDDDMLHEAFAPFGTITSARVMTDDNGASRGFGFVCYSTSEEAQRAIEERHNYEFKGKNLYVTIAQRRDSRNTPLMTMHPFFSSGMTNMPQPPQLGESVMGPSSPQLHQLPNQTRTAVAAGGIPMAAGQFVPYYYPMQTGFMAGRPWNQSMVGPNGDLLMFPGASSYGYPMVPVSNGNFRGGKQGNGFGSPSGKARGGQWRNGQGNGKQSGGGYQSKPNPQVSYLSTLSAVVASAASPEAEKQAIGEALYPRILRHGAVQEDSEMAAKLTGMMLELDTAELLKWVDDEVKLNEHIQQAYDQYMDFLASKK